MHSTLLSPVSEMLIVTYLYCFIKVVLTHWACEAHPIPPLFLQDRGSKVKIWTVEDAERERALHLA